MRTAVLTAVAWAYKNGARHIGHKSGSGVASGVFARCHRMAGNRVLMVSGTDEPQGLPEVDAPFASGESVVSFQRPSIASDAATAAIPPAKKVKTRPHPRAGEIPLPRGARPGGRPPPRDRRAGRGLWPCGRANFAAAARHRRRLAHRDRHLSPRPAA